MRHIEETTQEHCVRWFSLQYPEYATLLHHSPNGGARNPREGARFKRMGTRAGFPDLVFLLPRGGHPYLCIEFKAGKGRQSDAQREYQRAVESVGGLYALVRSFDEFYTLMNEYIEQCTT